MEQARLLHHFVVIYATRAELRVSTGPDGVTEAPAGPPDALNTADYVCLTVRNMPVYLRFIHLLNGSMHVLGLLYIR